MQTSAVPVALMPAVRWHRRGDVRVEDVPVPGPPGRNEIRVAVAWCGICGSDLHEYLSGPQSIPTRPHPVTGRCAPIVLGHEVSGWVEQAGPEVTGLTVGDLVVLNALLPCGRCPPCHEGALHLCRALGHIGMSADGGLAPLITVPASMAVRVPDGVSPDLAALAEPLAVAFHAVRLASPGAAGRVAAPSGTVPPGTVPPGAVSFSAAPSGTAPSGAAPRALVLGAGTIGLCVAVVLRARGTDVTIADLAPERLARARNLGLRTTALPDDTAMTGEAFAAGDAPVVYECSGAIAAAARAPRLAAPGGTVVLAGLPEAPVPVDLADVVLREVRLVGSMSHLRDADLVPAVAFLAEHGDVLGQLITDRIPLIDTVSRGFEILAGPDRGQHVKILVRVGGER